MTPPPSNVLAIDFDGVVHDWRNRLPGYKMGQPHEGAVASMQQLFSQGYRLIIFSARADTPASVKSIEDWLKYFCVPYESVTNVKPTARLYLDDNGVRFHTWQQALADINRYAPYHGPD